MLNGILLELGPLYGLLSSVSSVSWFSDISNGGKKKNKDKKLCRFRLFHNVGLFNEPNKKKKNHCE